MSPQETPEVPQARKMDRESLRKVMNIASYVDDTGMKIHPSNMWMPHYPNAGAREQTLQQLLNGEKSPDDIDVETLKPDGFTYDVKEYEALGLNGLVGKIRQQAELMKSFDYSGFAEFLYGFRDKDIDLATASEMFNHFGKNRVQSDLLKRLGGTGQKQLKASLKHDAQQISVDVEDKRRMQKLLDTLTMKWMQKKGIISQQQLKKYEKQTGAETTALADSLSESYLDYVNKGDTKARKKLVDQIKKDFETIQKQKQRDKLDDFIDQAVNDPDSLSPEDQEKIEDMFNDFEPPPQDAPPDFNDSFSPSMDDMKRGAEQQAPTALYTIEPPIKGHYQGPVYNHFNASQVRWETKPNLSPVSSGSASNDHTISGMIRGGSRIPLYLPKHFGVGSFNLPNGISLARDESGCYYLQNSSGSTQAYSVPFGKEQFASSLQPGTSETTDIGSHALSGATMKYIKGLSGSGNVQKGQQLVHFMRNVLKLDYSNEEKYNMIYKKNPSRYFTEIENHKQVDCDVAQTYFIALCRAAGIPSRIVTGHSVDYVKDGKAVIHGGSGHAWTEIWDDASNSWKTIDATPQGEPPSTGEKSEQAPEENPELDTPNQEPRDDDKPPSPEEVDQNVDQQVDQTQQQDQQTSPDQVPDSIKDQMEDMQQEQGESGEPQESGEQSVDDQDWQEGEQEMQDMQEQHEEMEQNAQDIKDQLNDAEKLDDLKDIQDKLENDELYDEEKDKLEELLDANKDKMFEDLKDEIEKMKDDGFIDEDKAEKMLEELQEMKNDLDALSKVEGTLSHESNLYNQYQEIKEEVMPLVDQWFEFFAERLPKIEEVDYDKDTTAMSGRFDKRSINKPRNLIFGRTQNPPIITSSIEPRFIASIVLDISGSMSSRMHDARKLLIFFAELFEKISEEFGYIKFSISAFDEVVEAIKDFDQEYNSSERYKFGQGADKTVKVRLMETTMARGGTDMGKAVWQANQKLNKALEDYPDHLSAMYTISDGATDGELAGQQLNKFLHGLQSVWGEWWGNHMKCGFMLGAESQKAVLAQYFGENDSQSVPQLDELIEKVMMRFDEDIQNFIDNLPS